VSVLIEIAVASAEDAATAERGGADRVELSAALALGGLTPSPGALLEAKAAVRLPVIAMARPRPAGFAYSDTEFRTLLRDTELLLANGADGIAFGASQPDGSVDVQRCREVVRLIGERDAVFHRAFDVTPDPLAALEQLVDMGVRRVLTSGQAATALDGAALLAELIRRAAGRIEILPAAGIRPANVRNLISRTGCTQVHASLRASANDPSAGGRALSFGGGPGPDVTYEITDAAAVAHLRWACDGHL
jgi:copper homeostasis protein